MPRFLQPLFLLLARLTDRQLAAVVQYLKAENEILRGRLPKRVALTMTPPAEEIEKSTDPPDIGRPRSKAERIEWFLASTYCTCGVSKDVSTGHFYTLAGCNPNGCGMPNHRREELGKLMDRGMTDREIFDELLKEAGPLLLRPHLMP